MSSPPTNTKSNKFMAEMLAAKNAFSGHTTGTTPIIRTLTDIWIHSKGKPNRHVKLPDIGAHRFTGRLSSAIVSKIKNQGSTSTSTSQCSLISQFFGLVRTAQMAGDEQPNQKEYTGTAEDKIRRSLMAVEGLPTKRHFPFVWSDTFHGEDAVNAVTEAIANTFRDDDGVDAETKANQKRAYMNQILNGFVLDKSVIRCSRIIFKDKQFKEKSYYRIDRERIEMRRNHMTCAFGKLPPKKKNKEFSEEATAPEEAIPAENPTSSEEACPADGATNP